MDTIYSLHKLSKEENEQIRIRFGNTVKSLRQKRTKLSQEQFGFHLGCHRTYISQIERGKRSPTLTMIVQIAHGLDMKTWELLRLMEETE